MLNDEPGADDEPKHLGPKRSSVQWPWSRRGWYTDEFYAHRDRTLDRKVEEAGRGLNPYGYYADTPGLATSPLMHNPYLNFVFVPTFAWLGVFLFDKLVGTLWFAISCLVFFGGIALLVAVMSAIRIPGWHRARKVATAYVAEHGGRVPVELRWYT